MIEVNTKLTFMDKGTSKKKSFFEIAYVSIVKINENVKDSKEIEKIILCDVQNEIYPNLEKIFENLLNDSGYQSIKFKKKIDFEKLYNQRIN
jgi:preprotein translocase subunit SecB